MNKVITFLLVMICTKAVMAQNGAVALDEHNKYIFYQVADAQGQTADSLYEKIFSGLRKSKYYRNSKFETVAGSSIKLKTKSMLYSNMTIAKHEAGELDYTLIIEFKDAKYRYWLTDFVFSEWERTRYGVYAKKPGASMPLEEVKIKIDKVTMNSYLDQISKLGQDTGKELTFLLSQPEKKITEPTKVDTRKW